MVLSTDKRSPSATGPAPAHDHRARNGLAGSNAQLAIAVTGLVAGLGVEERTDPDPGESSADGRRKVCKSTYGMVVVWLPGSVDFVRPNRSKKRRHGDASLQSS